MSMQILEQTQFDTFSETNIINNNNMMSLKSDNISSHSSSRLSKANKCRHKSKRKMSHLMKTWSIFLQVIVISLTTSTLCTLNEAIEIAPNWPQAGGQPDQQPVKLDSQHQDDLPTRYVVEQPANNNNNGDDDDDDQIAQPQLNFGLMNAFQDKLLTVKSLLSAHQQQQNDSHNPDEHQTSVNSFQCTHKGRQYLEGQTVAIDEQPCLNCTCKRAILQCYLRVCPPAASLEAHKRMRSIPSEQSCRMVKEAGQCCPTIHCDSPSSIVGSEQQVDKVASNSTDHQQWASDANTVSLQQHQQQQQQQQQQADGQHSMRMEDQMQVSGSSTSPSVVLASSGSTNDSTGHEQQLPKLTVINGLAGQRDSILLITSNPQSSLVASGARLAALANSTATTGLAHQHQQAKDSALIDALLETLYSSAAQLNGLNLQGSCMINGSLYVEGSAVMPENNAQCQYCYCIRQKIMCVRPRCHLMISGCTPKYSHEFACCPTSYVCSASPAAGLTGEPSAQLALLPSQAGQHGTSARLSVMTRGGSDPNEQPPQSLASRLSAAVEAALTKLTNANQHHQEQATSAVAPRQMDSSGRQSIVAMLSSMLLANNSAAEPTNKSTSGDQQPADNGIENLPLSERTQPMESPATTSTSTTTTSTTTTTTTSTTTPPPATTTTTTPTTTSTTSTSTSTTPAPTKPASNENDDDDQENESEEPEVAEKETEAGDKKPEAEDKSRSSSGAKKRPTTTLKPAASTTEEPGSSVSDFLEPMKKLGPHVLAPTVPVGCLENGRTYAIGEQIPTLESCKHCYCGPEGTKECKMIECNLKVAHGCRAITPSGHCCPIRYECPPFNVGAGSVVDSTSNSTSRLLASSRYRTTTDQDSDQFQAISQCSTSQTGLSEDCHTNNNAKVNNAPTTSGSGSSEFAGGLENIPGLHETGDVIPDAPILKSTRLVDDQENHTTLATNRTKADPLTDELNQFIMQINGHTTTTSNNNNNINNNNNTSSLHGTGYLLDQITRHNEPNILMPDVAPVVGPTSDSQPVDLLTRNQAPHNTDYHSVQPNSGQAQDSQQASPIPKGMFGIPSIEPEPIKNLLDENKVLQLNNGDLMPASEPSSTMGPTSTGSVTTGDPSSSAGVEYSSPMEAALVQPNFNPSLRDSRSTNGHRLEHLLNGSFETPPSSQPPAAAEVPSMFSDDYTDSPDVPTTGFNHQLGRPNDTSLHLPHVRLLRNHQMGNLLLDNNTNVTRQRPPTVVFDDEGGPQIQNNHRLNHTELAAGEQASSTPSPPQPTTGTPFGLDADNASKPNSEASNWLGPLPVWIRSFGKRISGQSELQGAASSNYTSESGLLFPSQVVRDESQARAARQQPSNILSMLKSIIASSATIQEVSPPRMSSSAQPLVMRPIESSTSFDQLTSLLPEEQSASGDSSQTRPRSMQSSPPYEPASIPSELEIVTAPVPSDPEIFGGQPRKPAQVASLAGREVVVAASSSFARRSDITDDSVGDDPDETIKSKKEPNDVVRYFTNFKAAQPPKTLDANKLQNLQQNKPHQQLTCFDLMTNRTYQANEIIPKDDPCKTCTCVIGQEICQPLVCPERPSDDCREEQQQRPGQCCPTYVCGTGSNKSEPINITSPSTTTQSPHQPSYIPMNQMNAGPDEAADRTGSRLTSATNTNRQPMATQRAMNVVESSREQQNGLLPTRQQFNFPKQPANFEQLGPVKPPTRLTDHPIRTSDLASILPPHLRFRPNLSNSNNHYNQQPARAMPNPLNSQQQQLFNYDQSRFFFPSQFGGAQQQQQQQQRPNIQQQQPAHSAMSTNQITNNMQRSDGSQQTFPANNQPQNRPNTIINLQQLQQQLNHQRNLLHNQPNSLIRSPTLMHPPRMSSSFQVGQHQQPSVNRRIDEIQSLNSIGGPQQQQQLGASLQQAANLQRLQPSNPNQPTNDWRLAAVNRNQLAVVPLGGQHQQMAPTVADQTQVLAAAAAPKVDQKINTSERILFQQSQQPTSSRISTFDLNPNLLDSGFRPITMPLPSVAIGQTLPRAPALAPSASITPTTSLTTTTTPTTSEVTSASSVESQATSMTTSAAQNSLSSEPELTRFSQPETASEKAQTSSEFAATTIAGSSSTATTDMAATLSTLPDQRNVQEQPVDTTRSPATPDEHHTEPDVTATAKEIHTDPTTTASTTTTSEATSSPEAPSPKTPESPEESSEAPAEAPFDLFAFKVSECDIYGRTYKVGQVIEQLSSSCKLCTCTASGVDCQTKC